jgi:hypothetical protein
MIEKLDAVYGRARQSLRELGYPTFELSRGYLYANLFGKPDDAYVSEFTETYVWFDGVSGMTWFIPLVADRERIRRDLQDLLDRGRKVAWFDPSGLKGEIKKILHECLIDTSVLSFAGPDQAKRRKEMSVIDRRHPVTVEEGAGAPGEIAALDRAWRDWKATRVGQEHVPDAEESQALLNAVALSQKMPGLCRVFRFYADGKLQGVAVTTDEGEYWCRLFVRTLPAVPALHLWMWKWLAEKAYPGLPWENDGGDIDVPSLKNSFAARKIDYFLIRPA